jgi:hypothetical protein
MIKRLILEKVKGRKGRDREIMNNKDKDKIT